MLVLLASLRRIPRTLLDATAMDGANTFSQFRYVSWPAVTGALFLILLLEFVFTVQSFTAPYYLQNRQQGDSLLVWAVYIYRTAFEPPYNLGLATAMCWVLFLVTAIMSGIFVWLSRFWVRYEVLHHV